MNRYRRNLLRTACIAAIGASLLGIAAMATAQQTQSPDAAKVLAEMGKATVIPEGSGPRVLYIFFDANCPYCHELYTALRSKVGKDGLEFRWVPVAVLTPSSVTKGAAILQASNRLAAFHENENTYGKGPNGKGGGIIPATKVSHTASAILNANNALLEATKSPGVPTLLYRDKQGDAMMMVGPPNPQQLKEILASVK
ncbi:MAG: thioredoxin fold domain-containing protein [Proteobacteria bacterium]|nr:thioredoxin fold domain-containing protein [Pseudomonadota bacterium]